MSALKTAIADLETYQQALASQSALGLVMSQVLHDGRRFLGDIATRSKALVDGAPRLQEVSAFGEHFRGSFPKNAQSISESTASLGKLFRALDPISGRRRGRPKTFSIQSVIKRCLELNADAIHDAGVNVELIGTDHAPNVIAYEADLMAALLNIIDNAIHWLSNSTALPRSLRISSVWSKEHVRISIANNGPEIGEQFIHRLFNPGFTLKADGSGLGLAIAREAMRSSKGDVAFDVESSDTTFVIEIRNAMGG
jgi:C4-dicarboxylate-specific signal transduction histidine kinase